MSSSLAHEHYEQGQRVIDALASAGAEAATAQFGAVTRKFPRADNVQWTKSDLLQILDSDFRQDKAPQRSSLRGFKLYDRGARI